MTMEDTMTDNNSEKAKEFAGEAAEKAKEVAGEAAEKAKEVAGEAAEKAKGFGAKISGMFKHKQ